MIKLRLPDKIMTPGIEKLRCEITESPRRTSAYKQMARVLISMDHKRLATRVLRVGLTVVPDDQGLLENLARAQYEAGFPGAAAGTWRRVKELFPESFLAYEKLERYYVRSGYPYKAVKMYHQVGENDPLQEKSLERIVFVCKEVMDVPGTIRALTKLISKYGITYRRCRDLGRFYFKADQYQEACRWIEKAFTIGDDDIELRLTLALSYARRKKYSLAEKNINHILAEKPNSFAGLMNLCEIIIEKGDIERGEAILARIEKLYPNNSRVALARGEIHLVRGDHSSAEESFRWGISKTAYFYRWELERGYRLLGHALEALGNEEDAAFYRLLAKLLSSNPDTFLAFIESAEEKLQADEIMTAGRIFQELSRMFPGNARVIIGEAEVAISKGYPSRAVEMVNRIVDKIPEKYIRDKIRGYRVLARGYKDLGDRKKSKESLSRAARTEKLLLGA